MANLILASASPRRVELLKLLGIAPEKIVPADIDETPRPNEIPLAYARRIAREKAEKVAAQYPNETVLAADTVVALGRRILPKAEDEATARRCLELMSGRRHRVITGVCVVRNGKAVSKESVSIVRMDRLTARQMDEYIESGEWNGKAGGYAIQGRAAAFIPFISGSHSGIVGLPLHMVEKLLRE